MTNIIIKDWLVIGKPETLKLMWNFIYGETSLFLYLTYQADQINDTYCLPHLWFISGW